MEETFRLERGKTLHDFIKQECEKPL
jgi:hypothetical protein